MTPQRWAAMQTAANRQDAHDWITIAAALEDVRLLVSRLDDRLGVLVADALTAIAEEAQR